MACPSVDREWMSRALQLALRGRFTTTPNPNVGCVITQGDSLVGEGWHRVAGEPHAEIYALRQAGPQTQGATCYVTLEPCSHQGRTGPCADALIAAGISRLVYGCEDPNPDVSGQGIGRLRAAGIQVDGPLLEEQAREVNRGFFRRHEQGLPWITVKTAASIDGRTAMASGESQWITSPPARRDVQFLRAESCAIVTGIGTVQFDDPGLNVRLSGADLGIEDPVRQPLRVVVDSRLQLSPQAQILRNSGSVLVATLLSGDCPEAKALSEQGAQVVPLPARTGRVDLVALMQELARRGCNRVLVEAGSQLAGAFVAEGLFDEWVLYTAPKLFGSDARPLFELPIQTIDAHLALSLRDIRQIGEDVKMTFQPDKDY